MIKTSAIAHSYRFISFFMCLFGLFSISIHVSAATPTPAWTQTPTATPTKAPTITFTSNPYPPPATPNFVTPDSSQSENSFLPLILRNYPPYHVKSQSYYMWTNYDVYGLGCGVGNSAASKQEAENVFVFLDFGNPYQNAQGVLGTKLYDQTFISTDQIATSVVIFSLGFYNCTSNDTIVIAVGTNSSGGTVTDVIAQSHGGAWANLIIEINNRYLDYPGLSSRVTAAGASNIEPGFNPAYIPRHWLDGYNMVSGRKPLYVIASADGCPQDYPPTQPETGYYSPGNCNDGWTQEDIYYVSWGASSSWPYPEIYNTIGANADQWYRIGLYSKLSHNYKMVFKGTMTQLAVCQQLREEAPYHPHCIGTDNDPTTGFIQLFTRINTDPYNRITNLLKWATDMKRYYSP